MSTQAEPGIREVGMKKNHRNRYRRISSNHRGFTLVEVLVAMIILAVGVLAVSQLTVMGSRTSTLMNRRMYARDILNQYYEEFTGLPTRDSLLTYQTSADLNDTIAPDYDVFEDTPGGRYRVIWNIADSMITATPDSRFKTVRIHVLWPQTRRSIRSDVLKRY
jgi:prepilin-type N-terminal cleavage/methylation domain-containing protein